MAFEKKGNHKELVNEAFRQVHTMKGNAGFFGFGPIENLCMETEFFLDSLRKKTEPVSDSEASTLLQFIDSLRDMVGKMSSTLKPDLKKPLLGSISDEHPEASITDSASTSVPNTQDVDSGGRYSIKKKDIRVDTEKLDSLFDLIGELITGEAMVIDNPDLKGLDLESFSKAASYLSKITREIQAIAMSIRMIPLEGLFGKMHRLVRDLSKKFKKPINLHLSGQETEMDRNIIEEISDPLVHIIRNSIDHGIEDESVRLKKGKEQVGNINLSARYEGNEIWISLKDDGAGLNTQRILAKALENQLINEGQVLSDAETWKLIFEPGFSTAIEVSEISGRGVGMDVVKKNIEKLRGQVSIFSVPEKGTEITLKIPLTLAILDGITLRAGDTLYSLPISEVAEFQNYDSTKITNTAQNEEVFRLRDEILPLIRLRSFFQIAGEYDNIREVIIVIKNQNRKIALVVDEILGYKQIVIKSLPEFMGHRKGISGCTILGNGDVSLIIDINDLFRRALDV